MIPAIQRETAALLARLAGGPPIETHISAVFVGADTVWKLKKAVLLPFHDFTALAERERTTRRELELNAADAPGMYRDVVPVVRGAGGRIALGGDGEVVDWVLRMARVPAADFLDAVAAAGGLTPALLDAIADAVAAMHARLAPLGRDQAAGLRDIAAGNRASALASGLPPEIVTAWEAAMAGALAAVAPWLARRGAAGFVRRIHGDLHLGNLCLWQGRPVPFDALEFDEDMAIFDLGYDLAFLLMDLDVRAGRAAANRVMNRYFARTGDVDMLHGMKPFLSMRAMVRAHVETRAGHVAAGAEYLDRALAYLRPVAPVVLAIGGLQGTGKSTVARAIAPELGPAPGAAILRSDEIRKFLHGAAPEAKLPEAAYTPAASRAVFDRLAAQVATAVSAGHAAIADATFMNPAHRGQITTAATGVPFHGIWLMAGLAELEARVAARTGDASDAGIEVLRDAAQHDPGPGAWHGVKAGAADDPSGAIRLIMADKMPI
ncbi:MAG: AAA family ATPase [Alphaproteobacteria bacterium]|nr:AAA family ATPase [Alphaproteobacteria bacterium]